MMEYMQRLEDMVKVALPVGDKTEAGLHEGISRRNFLKLVSAAAIGYPAAAQGEGIRKTTYPNGAFLNDFVGFLDAKYAKGDNSVMFKFQERLTKAHGIPFPDLHTDPHKHLLERDLFLMRFQEGPESLFNLFRIDKQEDFKSFKDDAGNDRRDLHGVEFSPLKVAYLGELLWSTNKNAVFAGFKKIPDIGTVIGIPYAFAEPFIAYGDKVVKSVIERIVIHEAAHAHFRTPNERFAMLVEFSCRLDKGVRICSVADIDRYLASQGPRQTPEVRICLDELYMQDPDPKYFKNQARARNWIANGIQRITEELHEMNKNLPGDPMKISNKGFYATNALLLRNHPLLIKAKSPYLC